MCILFVCSAPFHSTKMARRVVDHSTIRRSDITIEGDFNTIHGDNVTVIGGHNTITGDHCTANGDLNTIIGDHCTVIGDHNSAEGRNNRVDGSFCSGDNYDDYCDVVRPRAPEPLLPEPTDNMVGVITTLTGLTDTETEDEKHCCCVCLTNVKQVAFIPCGHLEERRISTGIKHLSTKTYGAITR